MRLVDQQTAEAYLRDSGRVALDEPVQVRELPGGVSNMVLLVERPQRPSGRFVIKQARAQLRTREPWFSSVERIWREADVLVICSRLIEQCASKTDETDPPPAETPRILFEDRENYLLAMTAAPEPNVTWKDELLVGRADSRIAAACGRLLGTLHAGSWLEADIDRQIGDRTLFDQLRVDPYYRTLAEAQPETRQAIERLIRSLNEHPRSLVHADFSPKNLLVFSDGLMMVDFETGHFGDPAFDLGFFLSHLLLKAAYHAPRHAPFLDLAEAFRQSYDRVLTRRVAPEELSNLWARGMQNLAGCALARRDGKSPVEYLSDVERREQVRAVCREIFESAPRDWPPVAVLCRRMFGAEPHDNRDLTKDDAR